jgi:hypothetical protein
MIIEDEGAMNLGFDHEHEINSFILVSHGENQNYMIFFKLIIELGIEQLALNYKKI